MTFSKGQIIFACIAIAIFIVGIGFAYAKDKPIRKTHYKGFYWVLIAIAAVVAFYFILIKLLGN